MNKLKYFLFGSLLYLPFMHQISMAIVYETPITGEIPVPAPKIQQDYPSEQTTITSEIELRNKIYTALRGNIRFFLEKNLTTAIHESWIQSNMDSILEDCIKKAGKEIKNNADLMKKLKTAVSAEEVIEEILEKTFDSRCFQQGFDKFQEELSRNLNEKMIDAMPDILTKVIEKYIAEYLTENYGLWTVNIFNEYFAKTLLEIKADAPEELEIGPGTLLLHRKKLIGGIPLVAMKKVFRKALQSLLLKRLGKRLLGKLINLIPVIGQIVGAGLIMLDVADILKGGAIDTVIEELVKKKNFIESSLIYHMKKEILNQKTFDDISIKLTDNVMKALTEFKVNYRILLEQSKEYPKLKSYLNTVTGGKVFYVAEIFKYIHKYGGESEVKKVSSNPTYYLSMFSEAPPSILDLIKDMGNVDKIMEWLSFVGITNAKRLAILKLYNYADPLELDRRNIEKLFRLYELDHRIASKRDTIGELLKLERNVKEVIFTLPDNVLKNLILTQETPGIRCIGELSMIIPDPEALDSIVRYTSKILADISALCEDKVKTSLSLAENKIQFLEGFFRTMAGGCWNPLILFTYYSQKILNKDFSMGIESACGLKMYLPVLTICIFLVAIGIILIKKAFSRGKITSEIVIKQQMTEKAPPPSTPSPETRKEEKDERK